MRDRFSEMRNVVYSYVNEADDADECVDRLNKALEFVIGLRQSYVDNDKPCSNIFVNGVIKQLEDAGELKVDGVLLEVIDNKIVDLKER